MQQDLQYKGLIVVLGKTILLKTHMCSHLTLLLHYHISLQLLKQIQRQLLLYIHSCMHMGTTS